PLKRHHRHRSGVLSDLGLFGRGHIHDHPALQALRQTALNRPGSGPLTVIHRKPSYSPCINPWILPDEAAPRPPGLRSKSLRRRLSSMFTSLSIYGRTALTSPPPDESADFDRVPFENLSNRLAPNRAARG